MCTQSTQFLNSLKSTFFPGSTNSSDNCLPFKSFEVFAMKIVVYYLLLTKVRNISILGPTDELWFCSFGFMCCFFNLFAAWAAWHSRSSSDIGQWSKYHRESRRCEIHSSLKPSFGINFQSVLVFQRGLKSSFWFLTLVVLLVWWNNNFFPWSKTSFWFSKTWWCFFNNLLFFPWSKIIIFTFQNPTYQLWFEGYGIRDEVF